MLDDNSALFWGFVFIEFISFIFIKFWGKKIIPTFISGFLFSFVILNYISFFDEKTALNVILPLIGTSSLVLLICLSLKENDSLQILKRKSIYLASAACLVMGKICSDKKNYIFDGISYSFFEIENSHGCDPGSLGTGGGPVDPRKGTSSGGPTGGGRK